MTTILVRKPPPPREPPKADTAALSLPRAAPNPVLQYVSSQVASKSRQTALEALWRIARVTGGDYKAVEALPWHEVSYEFAMLLRRKLADLTQSGELSPGSANLTLVHFRGLIRTMRAMRLISPEQAELASPGVLKRIPGFREPRGKALSPFQIKRLRKVALDLPGYQGVMLDCAIVLAIGAGLRREELARIPAAAFREGRDMFPVIGKGNKERSCVIDPIMKVALRRWLEERTELGTRHEFLFCSPEKPQEPLSPQGFWKLTRKAAHLAFAPKGGSGPCSKECYCLAALTGPHDFRRTFATRLFEQRVEVRDVQIMMGHASPETTARYDKRAHDAVAARRREVKILP